MHFFHFTVEHDDAVFINHDEFFDIINNNKHNDTIIENNKHKDNLSHKSYSKIWDELYNVMRKIKQYQHLLLVFYWK